MADVKWIHIVTDIFDDEKMIAIETQQDGYMIEVVWFKILCIAGKCNRCGLIVIAENFPYTIEMLAKVFRMDIGTVKRAMDIFCALGMIVIEDNTYAVANWLKYQNNAGLEQIREKGRIRTQKCRERQKLAMLTDGCNVTCNVTSSVTSNVTPSYSNSISISNNLNLIEDDIEKGVVGGKVEKPVSKKKTKSETAKEANAALFNALSGDYEFTENQTKIIEEWILYKSERGEDYKERGMKSLLTIFKKNFKENGDTAVMTVVQESSGNGYQGITWNKMKYAEKNQPVKSYDYGKPTDFYD